MPRRTCLSLLVLAALLPASSAGAAVKVRHGVVYGHAQVAAGSAPLVLDLYRPARRATTPRPVVVVIHGGGFTRRGRTNPGIVRVARALAARGIVAATIDYRLLGAGPRPSRRVAPLLGGLPHAPLGRAIAAAVDDTLTSIGYLRRHAGRLGIDVRRLGLVGSSAGAMTAGHVAYVLDDYGIKGPKVRFVGDLWGGIVVAGEQVSSTTARRRCSPSTATPTQQSRCASTTSWSPAPRSVNDGSPARAGASEG